MSRVVEGKQLSALSKLFFFSYASVQKSFITLKTTLVLFNPSSSVASRGSGFALKGYLTHTHTKD